MRLVDREGVGLGEAGRLFAGVLDRDRVLDRLADRHLGAGLDGLAVDLGRLGDGVGLGCLPKVCIVCMCLVYTIGIL